MPHNVYLLVAKRSHYHKFRVNQITKVFIHHFATRRQLYATGRQCFLNYKKLMDTNFMQALIFQKINGNLIWSCPLFYRGHSSTNCLFQVFCQEKTTLDKRSCHGYYIYRSPWNHLMDQVLLLISKGWKDIYYDPIQSHNKQCG